MHLHVRIHLRSCVLPAISPQGFAARSQALQGAAARKALAPQPIPTELPQQKVAKLIQKLDNLLLLNGKELELWEELKAEASKLCLPPQVMADNDHI